MRKDQNELINQQGFSFSGYERDGLFLNLGNKRFKEISGVSGIDSITDGRAAVFADFDNDGDYDVFMTTIQGESHLLFHNNVGQENKWLRISLEGATDASREAFGAVARVKTSAGTLTKIKSGGSGFISQHDSRLLFGLGRDARAQSIEVTWPNGRIERFTGEMRAGSSLLLREGAGRTAVLNLKRAKLPKPLTPDEEVARGLRIAVGRTMPDLPLNTIDGAKTSVRQQLKPGHRLLINVWATWCTPCATEMPELQLLSAKLSSRRIDLLGLNVDIEPGADVKGFLSQQRITYPVFLGGVEAIELLYATDEMAVPLSILIDDKGVVIDIISGWSVGTQRKLRTLAGDPLTPKQ